MDKLTCFECQSENVTRERVHHEITVGGVVFDAQLDAFSCQECEQSIIESAELERFEQKVALELAQHGLRSPEAVKFMRKAIGLRGIDLAELLQVTPDTISRWERGGSPIDNASFAVLGSLVIDEYYESTNTLDRLKALSKPFDGHRVDITI